MSDSSQHEQQETVDGLKTTIKLMAEQLGSQRRKDRLLLAGLAMAGILAGGCVHTDKSLSIQALDHADALLEKLEARDD